MDASAMAIWVTVLSTILRDFEPGKPLTIQYVHDLLSSLDGFRVWHGDPDVVYSKAYHTMYIIDGG